MATIEYVVKVLDNGSKHWYRNDQRHREDGPAIEYPNGDKRWYRNGQLHREDGPAMECANGDKFWYRNGKEMTETEFNTWKQPKDDCNGKTVVIDGKTYKLTLV